MPTLPLLPPLPGSRAASWSLLLLLSVGLSLLFSLARLPASLLMGPMVAAIILATRGMALRIPPLLHLASQAVIGTMIAHMLTPSILGSLRTQWPLLLLVVFSTIAAASFLGWLLGRLRILPGTTAIWGLSPGAASVMMVMAEAYGADARLVAFMQYLRVVVVVTVASLVVRFWLPAPGLPQNSFSLFAAVPWKSFLETLLVLSLGTVAGKLSRIPAGAMLLPMILGSVLHAEAGLSITLPPLLLAVAYTLLGWGIGLGFTRPILLHALTALPRTLMAILALVLFSGLIALLLVDFLGMDPLTAYLATSPGGMDSVAIIASSAPHLDISFIMALQTLRFMGVLLLGPVLSRFLADRMVPAPPLPAVGKAASDPLVERVREDEDELD
ncbi:MAG: AbrB family transcriptional regulator [Nitrospiraceae bacterium]|nr:AbrB family transcriptional regulator [Nitrospiraceae bacterium]